MAAVRWDEMEAAIAANTQKHVGIGGGAVTRSVSSLPTEAGLSWLPGWCEDTLTVADGVALSLWIRDPLYRVATPSLRRSMEMEEAQYLIHQTEAMWSKGRSWVRKHLEEDLRVRAGGGAPAPDAWESAMKVRRAALLLDYIFTVRGLRVVLWWPNHKTVSVIPMTGADTVTQINCLSGRVLVKSGSTVSWPAWQQLMLTAADDIVWIPPASAPAGSLTVAQIQERIKAMGGQVTGNRQILWNRLMWLTATTKVASNDEPEAANVTSS